MISKVCFIFKILRTMTCVLYKTEIFCGRRPHLWRLKMTLCYKISRGEVFSKLRIHILIDSGVGEKLLVQTHTTVLKLSGENIPRAHIAG